MIRRAVRAIAPFVVMFGLFMLLLVITSVWWAGVIAAGILWAGLIADAVR